MKQQFLNCMCSIVSSLQTAAEWGPKNGLWFVAAWSCTVRTILMWYYTDMNRQLHVPDFYPQGESPASMVDPRQFYLLSSRAKSGLPIPGPSHHTDSARSNFTITINIDALLYKTSNKASQSKEENITAWFSILFTAMQTLQLVMGELPLHEPGQGDLILIHMYIKCCLLNRPLLHLGKTHGKLPVWRKSQYKILGWVLNSLVSVTWWWW
jgi:hypothetical protein